EVESGSYLKKDRLMIRDNGVEYFICHRDELKVPGIHNVQNALAAAAISYHSGLSIETISRTLTSFESVEHRLEFLSRVNGIDFINDAKRTNTDASITAIHAFNTPIVLIAGGYDKKVSFDEWIDSFKGKVKYLILIGET